MSGVWTAPYQGTSPWGLAMVRDFIVLRSSPDWLQFDIRDSMEFCRRMHLPEDTVINFCHTWDALFGVGYREFRAAVKDIAFASFRACRDVEIISAADLPHSHRHAQDRFFFTDDDDWFHPDIAPILREKTCPAADAAFWGSIRFGARSPSTSFTGAGGPFIERRPIKDVVYTNNYLVGGAAIAKCTFPLLMEHFTAQSLLTGPILKVDRINHYLSCAVKHPASTMFIVNATKFSKDKDVLRALFVEYCDAMAHCSYDPQTFWIKPYAERINDLCARTLASAK